MRRLFAIALAFLSLPLATQRVSAQAFPINSDVALQPAEGQFIYRTQLRFRDFEFHTPDADIESYIWSHVLVYGWTPRLSTVIGVPLISRDFESSMGSDTDTGIGDINLILRYQLWKKLGHLESQSWTALAGVQVPSYDDPFSSRSWDPIVGTVYSWRKNRQGFDADLVYKLNTENDRDFRAGDVLRYDVGYQYRLWPAEYTSETQWSLTGLLELNGVYQWESEMDGSRLDETDGHQLFLSPGLVLAGKRVKYEAGFQFPIYQSVGDRAPEDNVRFVIGFTKSF